ncbi:hypothetical protein [Pseudoalteromonas sp. SCQQ13]|uniref:hypothetical protein n=1 Tax=Pseudoalteromonas sp. SCQQ13 TaxID=2792066 RepID=UPI0018CE21E2|nr:hypothetical protein [Pseudoalteromonas sp. SCQQ13]MBH0093346.1 hypothetical protein [Pseudoalteromonas sp. SCQQ13]
MNKRKPRINFENYDSYSKQIQLELDLEVIDLYFRFKQKRYTKKDQQRFKAICVDQYYNPEFYYETILDETALRLGQVRRNILSRL